MQRGTKIEKTISGQERGGHSLQPRREQFKPKPFTEGTAESPALSVAPGGQQGLDE